MKTFRVMLKTELKLSLRGMDMLIFAIIMPLVVLLIIGMIFGGKPAFEGAEYTFLDQSFGALATISICAGGVMGLPLVVSDYRGRKILKRFRATPVSPAMILIVQVAIYTLYSAISLILVIFSMFSLGMMVGGIAPDTKSAGVIASLLYFPMLIFSGATLPYEIMPPAFQTVANVLPLTQGIKILKAACLGLPPENAAVPALIMAALAVICVTVSFLFFKWE